MSVAGRFGAPVFVVGAWLAWVYLVFALLYGLVGLVGATTLIVLGGAALLVVATRMRPERLFAVGFCLGWIAVLLVAADTALGVRDNLMASENRVDVAERNRARDAQVWQGELLPRTYVPAGQRFRLYKPNVRLVADSYGAAYRPAMLSSPMLATVLERRRIEYAIGPEGLREIEPLASSRVMALGDSFTFGYATTEGQVWTDQLGVSLGQPVFNLGVSGSGPRQQVDLVRYLYETYPGAMKPADLLWMLFEGNDLDASSFAGEQSRALGVLKGTPLEPLLSLPLAIHRSSALGRLARGELVFGSRPQAYGQWVVDGVSLPIPMFHSARFGNRLFYPEAVDAVRMTDDDVANHPNRADVDQSLREMAVLGHRHGFKVTLIFAPSNARLYGPSFDGFPEVAEPAFAKHYSRLAVELGFQVIDLLPAMRQAAANEMLYWRDDEHWNVRGHQVVAELIRSRVKWISDSSS